jgi:tetratricopeptide (TPR) repeat protein
MSAKFKKSATFLLSFVLAMVGLVLAEDEVQRRGTSVPVRGTITAENAHEITIQRKDTGKVETIPVRDVAKVKYEGGKVATEFAQAEIFERGGEYQKAVEAYARIAQEHSSKDLVVRAATFGRVSSLVRQALRDDAKVDEAIAALEEFRKQFPASRFHYTLHEQLGQLYLAKGNAEAAGLAYGELSKAPWPELKLKATNYAGRVLLARDEVDAALAKFDEVVGSAGDSADELTRRAEAVLGKSECLIKLKKFEEAESNLRTLVQSVSHDESSIRAAVHNFLGDVLRETNRHDAAIENYLYVDVYYTRERDEHAKALCYIAQLFERRGQNDRAEETRTRLKKDYPASPWVKVSEEGKQPL